jgi:hypothetical protein
MFTFILAAALVAHQPVLGPEILSAPQPPASRVLQPSVGIAADRGSAVVAWAGGDHVFVSVLGIDGRLGEATDIPASAPVAPSLVSFRGGYLLAWVEKTVPERAISVRLTAGLQPMQPQQAIIAETAQLRGDGTSALLLTGSTAYALTEDAGLNLSKAIDAGDDIAVMGSSTSAHLWHEVNPCGHFNWGCGGTDLYVEVDGPDRKERITAIQTTTGMQTITSPAAIAFDGQRLLVACYNVEVDVTHLSGFRGLVQVRPYDAVWLAPPITIGMIWDPSMPVRPSIASDGRRFVIVWRSWNGEHYEVNGAIIDNSTLVVTPLEIARGPNDAFEPGIAAIAPGRFLITWTSLTATERRLGARFLDFGETPMRQRPSH